MEYIENHKLLLLDDINYKNTNWLIHNLQKLKCEETIVVIKDKDEPACAERINSFSNQNYLLESGRNFPPLDPVKFGQSGYFRDHENLRCYSCKYSIHSAKIDALLSEKNISVCNQQDKALLIIDADHRKFIEASQFTLCSYGESELFLRRCYALSPQGNTLVSSVEHDKTRTDVQCYLELQVNEEPGKPAIRTVPGCLIIATQPETQLISPSELAYQYSTLSKSISFTFLDFDSALKALMTTDEIRNNMEYIEEIYKKQHILIQLKPLIRALYNKLHQWKAEHLLTTDSGSNALLTDYPLDFNPDNYRPNFAERAELMELIKIKAVASYYPEEKKEFKQLLQTLLQKIKTLEPDEKSVSTSGSLPLANHQPHSVSSKIAKKGLASLLYNPTSAATPHHETGVENKFMDSGVINRESIEPIEPILHILTEMVLTPIRYILGEDYKTLDPEIRDKIFLEPATNFPQPKPEEEVAPHDDQKA